MGLSMFELHNQQAVEAQAMAQAVQVQHCQGLTAVEVGHTHQLTTGQ